MVGSASLTILKFPVSASDLDVLNVQNICTFS